MYSESMHTWLSGSGTVSSVDVQKKTQNIVFEVK